MRSGTSRKPDQCGGRGTGAAREAPLHLATRASRSLGLARSAGSAATPTRRSGCHARATRSTRPPPRRSPASRAPSTRTCTSSGCQWKHIAALRVREQLASLAALVVRVEDEAALVHLLEQHDAHARLPVAPTVPSANAVGSGRRSAPTPSPRRAARRSDRTARPTGERRSRARLCRSGALTRRSPSTPPMRSLPSRRHRARSLPADRLPPRRAARRRGCDRRAARTASSAASRVPGR